MSFAKEDYPALYQVADAGSLAGQRWYLRLTRVELGLAVAGALVASVISFLPDAQAVAALVAAIAFTGALLIRIIVRQRNDDDAWFDGRAVAESAKTQAWRYMMRVPPYDADESADRSLVQDLTATLLARPALGSMTPLLTDARQITSRMRAVRALSLEERRDTYLDERLMDQIGWYRTAAIRHRRASGRWSIAALLAESAAVVTALTAVFSEQVAQLGLLGLFASLTAAFSAWNQLGRHGEVSRAYGLAHQELLAIASLCETIETEEDLASVFEDGEGAISREHTMWVAK